MILKIFLFWRFGLFVLTYLGSSAMPKIENSGLGAVAPGQNFNYFLSWAQWDGGHYFDIATSGYSKLTDYAFFPLYPLLARLLGNLLFNNYLLAGLFLSNIFFLAFLYLFFKIIKERYSRETALTSLITLLVFPTTFFAVSFYSESLFLLILTLFFYFLDKNKFLTSSILVSVASLTRLFGIILVVPLFYKYLLSFDPRRIRGLLNLSTAFYGISIYSLYLFAKLNDPFKFINIQSLWQREITDPISTLFSYIWPIITFESRPVNDYFDLSLSLIFFVVLILGTKKLPSTWWIFSLLVILIPASTNTLTSMPRYLLSCLGASIIIGQYLKTRPRLRIVLWSVSLSLQVILASRFINGYWVA